MIQLEYILVVCVIVTEILPFMKYFNKAFKSSNSILLLLFHLINYLYNLIIHARTAEQKEMERIEKIVHKVFSEHHSHDHNCDIAPISLPNNSVTLPSRHGQTEIEPTLPPIKALL